MEQPTKRNINGWTNWWARIRPKMVPKIKTLATWILHIMNECWASILLINPTMITLEALTLKINLLANLCRQLDLTMEWATELHVIQSKLLKVKDIASLRKICNRILPWAYKPNNDQVWKYSFRHDQLAEMDKSHLDWAMGDSEVGQRYVPNGMNPEQYHEVFDPERGK